LFLDIEYFKKFRVEFGTLIWGDGEEDIAPETLYTKATGKKIIYTSEKNSVQPQNSLSRYDTFSFAIPGCDTQLAASVHFQSAAAD